MSVAEGDPLLEAAAQHEEKFYGESHAQSRQLLERMSASLPGGDTRTTAWFDPFPPVIEEGSGAEIVDADGNRLLDFLGNYTELVHGHNHPAVTQAIARELPRGFVFAAPLREQALLGDHLTRRIASADLVRFTNSGTEANMLAVRIARAFTGRHRIAVAAHSYHGAWDDVDWTQAQRTGTVVFTVNDWERTKRSLDGAGPLAAVVIEPVLGAGGVIAASKDYLARLLDYTKETGAVLIFDEVMCFRLAYGGVQGMHGLRPDLTSLGKIIGGGLPVGAVAGSAELMMLTDPHRPDSLMHGGTNNGHRLVMVAGLAALEALDAVAIERINALGGRLAAGLREAAACSDLPVSVTSAGSMVRFHGRADVTSPEQADIAARSPLARYLHLALVNRGIYLAPRGQMSVSTAMDETAVDAAVRAFSDALSNVAA
jgi:glutamate-1-semialdehyde 2,1-aminomutase